MALHAGCLSCHGCLGPGCAAAPCPPPSAAPALAPLPGWPWWLRLSGSHPRDEAPHKRWGAAQRSSSSCHPRAQALVLAASTECPTVTRGIHEPCSLHQQPLCGLAMGSVPRYLLTTPPNRPPWPTGQQALGPCHETQSPSRAHTCRDKHSEHPDAHRPPSMGTCGRLAAPHPGDLVIHRAPNHSQVTSRTQPSMAKLPSPKATKAECRSHYHLGMPAAQPHHRGGKLGIKPPILKLDPPLHRTGKEQQRPTPRVDARP